MSRRAMIRLANPPRKKGKAHEPVTVFDLKGLAVLIAKHINEVPKDVRFAALAVMVVKPPTASHIHAARRLSGRPPISDQHAALLAPKRQNVVLAAILKSDLGTQEVATLEDLEHPDTELPGYDEAKRWARGLRSDVARWREGNLPWQEVAGGALISGPPGTGKTFFAAALASALGLRLISTTIGEWQSAGALDDTLMAMRSCFEDANDGRGAVLFIDELDSIGSRSSKPTGRRGNHYWQIVLNEFLSLLTGLGEGVVVIGATNFLDWIDPAILRAGRLQQPRGGKLAARILGRDCRIFGWQVWRGFGKDRARCAEDCPTSGSRAGIRDLSAQLPEKTRYTPQDLLRLAVHEAGHALISLAVGYATSATIEIKDSFESSAQAYLGGLISYELTEDHVPTETSLLNRMAVGLAGMAAEAAVFGDRSLGSGGTIGSDIERASSIARRLVGSYGPVRRRYLSAPLKSWTRKDCPKTLRRKSQR
ncbi:AAA family ATPase [Mycoplana dimorpha]|uniref:Peptidase M41-like protein n=1 Tax=Mycoplana dimorpha TaxID=28320 RepID=A0A2T5AZ08_MYCDI|nr:AAA family ATPase [Mycoplana dimorpha]PTM91968.1 peptidase M41-like protein [Mycoplana dimorpha]